MAAENSRLVLLVILWVRKGTAEQSLLRAPQVLAVRCWPWTGSSVELAAGAPAHDLSSWWSPEGQTSYLLLASPLWFPRGVAGSYLAFSGPALEVTLHHFCLSLLVEAMASPPRIQSRKQSPTPHGRTLGTCMKTATQPFSWLPLTTALSTRLGVPCSSVRIPLLHARAPSLTELPGRPLRSNAEVREVRVLCL